MTAKILDGRSVAIKLQQAIKLRIANYLAEGKRSPGLSVILLGDDQASALYVKNKQNACNKVGIKSDVYRLSSDIAEIEVLKLIDELNANPHVDGILVQLPLPKQIDSNKILEKVNPNKDVDGFHPYNMGCLVQQRPNKLRPCTPAGIMMLLEHYHIELSGLEAVVIGVSNIVGRPMILELLMAGCTVTACHRRTRNLEDHVKRADLLIIAAGKPRLIPGSWIKPGAIAIDVGINREENGQLIGDLDMGMDTAIKSAAWITPVPGGVGPMTVTALLQNTVLAYEQHLKLS